MATFNYRLKKGYIAQFAIAFKGIKAFSNDQMTDELAAEYLRQYPARIIYFERIPGKAVIPPGIKIIKPGTKPKIKIIKPKNILEETLGNITGEGSEEVDERTKLRASLDELNIKYHPATGVVKLRKLLADAVNLPE